MQNSKLQFKIKNLKKFPFTFNFKLLTLNSSGFTLIELLVVMGLLTTIGAIIGSIMYSSLRGSQKTTTINDVRENGSYAMIQMTKMIREAASLEVPSTCVPTITASTITIKSLDGGITQFSCTGTTISSNSAELIDATKVKVDPPGNCSFICSQSSIYISPTISIQFSLSQFDPSPFFEQNATIPFRTTVGMRNVRP